MRKNPIWFYEEKQAGINYLDPKVAENYDIQHQKFRDFKKEAEFIVQMLDITSEDTVIDFACGRGV